MKKKIHLWVVSVTGLIACVGTVLIVSVFPHILGIPLWLWRRSHPPGIPTLIPSTTVPISQSYPQIVLAPENLTAITELAHFIPPSVNTGPVAALTFTSDGQFLLAAYAQEGMLRRWHLDGTLQAVFDVSPVGIAATEFDGQGQFLVTAAGRTPRAEATGYAVTIYGSRLWDARTGELIWEVASGPEFKHIVSGVALSSDGRLLAQVEPQSLDIWDTISRKRIVSISLGGTEDPFRGRWIKTTPDVITFDPSGEMVAWADREGRIRLEQWDPVLDWFMPVGPTGEIDWARDNDHTIPLAIEFDGSRAWLAVVRGEQFELWSIGGRYIRRTLLAGIPTGPASDVAFSPASDLVAVGTNRGWQIWDVRKGRKLAEGGDSPVFALTFSPDGCLFMWGDEEGVIHTWGVPNK